ncbi:leucine-rich repeat transmembrane protein kinase protein [Tanacetum coccineum]
MVPHILVKEKYKPYSIPLLWPSEVSLEPYYGYLKGVLCSLGDVVDSQCRIQFNTDLVIGIELGGENNISHVVLGPGFLFNTYPTYCALGASLHVVSYDAAGMKGASASKLELGCRAPNFGLHLRSATPPLYFASGPQLVLLRIYLQVLPRYGSTLIRTALASLAVMIEFYNALKLVTVAQRNNFTRPLPAELLAKSKKRSLFLSIEEIADQDKGYCLNGSCKNKKQARVVIPVMVAIATVIMLLTASAIVWMMIKRKNPKDTSTKEGSFKPSNQHYTYFEVRSITKNFKTVIGKGGFGTVFRGSIGDNQVAVKILSESSSQGYKEFQAEVNYYC